MSSAAVQLGNYQVGADRLSSLYYIPNYITESEEQLIMREVHASQAKWVQLSGRRLQNHGGTVHPKGLIPAAMPRWLEQLGQRIHSQLALFGEQPPNHVLINSYQPGCGIMPHQDGPLYHPVVCILSLGSPAVLRFWRKQPESGTGNLPPVASLLAMPRSLLVFADEAYQDCLHGIQEVAEETIDASVVNPDAIQQAQQQQQQRHGQQHEQPQEQQQMKQHEQHTAWHPQPAAGVGAEVVEAQAESRCRIGCDSCSTAASVGSPELAVVPRQGERISLTIRRVIRVHKALGIIRR